MSLVVQRRNAVSAQRGERCPRKQPAPAARGRTLFGRCGSLPAQGGTEAASALHAPSLAARYWQAFRRPAGHGPRRTRTIERGNPQDIVVQYLPIRVLEPPSWYSIANPAQVPFGISASARPAPTVPHRVRQSHRASGPLPRQAGQTQHPLDIETRPAARRDPQDHPGATAGRRERRFRPRLRQFV